MTEKNEKTEENEKDDISILKSVGRIVAGAYYDMQEVRISNKNRLRDVIRKKHEGIPFDAVEETREEEEKARGKYKDEELKKIWNELLEKGEVEPQEHKYVLKCWKLADDTEKIENQYKARMMEFVKDETITRAFLLGGDEVTDNKGTFTSPGIRGIGPVLAANLINHFGNCERYDTVSKLWAHTGNGVIGGKAPQKRKGEDITFSPHLRKMTWNISNCLMKANKGLYRQIYDTEKERQLAREYPAGQLFKKYGKPYKEEDTSLSRNHAHNRALRKMRKMFLSHYWAACKELTGQDTRKPFVIEELGHDNLITWQEALRKEQQPLNKEDDKEE